MRLAPALLLLTFVNCNSSQDSHTNCTTEFKTGVRARLENAATGDPVSGAVVTLTDGAFVETMVEVSPGVYDGAHERKGTYELVVTATGYLPHMTNGLQVTHDGCHVRMQEVTIALGVVNARVRLYVLRFGDSSHTIDEAHLVHSIR